MSFAKTIAFTSLLVSIVLFVASLFFNAYYSGGTSITGTNAGILLVMGWMSALLARPEFFCWLASPLLFTGWVLLLLYKRAAWILNGLAMLCSLSFLLVSNIVANEGGGEALVVRRSAGYWLWCSSILVAFAGSVVLRKAQRKDSQTAAYPTTNL